MHPASPPSEMCWRCCSEPMSGKTTMIFGWKMSPLPWQRMFSFFRTAGRAKKKKKKGKKTAATILILLDFLGYNVVKKVGQRKLLRSQSLSRGSFKGSVHSG